MKKNYKMLLNKLYGNYYTRIVHKFSKQTKNISCTILIEVKTKNKHFTIFYIQLLEYVIQL